jgi:hypothetical protein
MRDLWTHKDQPVQADGYSAVAPPHDVVLLRIFPAKR